MAIFKYLVLTLVTFCLKNDFFLVFKGKNEKLLLVDTLFCSDKLRRKWTCYEEVWAGCIQEVIQAQLSSFPSQTIKIKDLFGHTIFCSPWIKNSSGKGNKKKQKQNIASILDTLYVVLLNLIISGEKGWYHPSCDDNIICHLY